MGRLGNLRRRVLLEDREIPLHQAEAHLLILRRAILSVAIPTVVLGGVLAVNWPVAVASALRIMLDRQVAMAGMGAAAYTQGIAEVTDLEIRVHSDLTIPEEERTRKFWDLDAIRLGFLARREAMDSTFQRAVKARNALPARIWWTTPWTDPLTGGTFRASATREEIAHLLTEQKLQDEEQQAFLNMVLVGTQPGAKPLPAEKDILK